MLAVALVEGRQFRIDAVSAVRLVLTAMHEPGETGRLIRFDHEHFVTVSQIAVLYREHDLLGRAAEAIHDYEVWHSVPRKFVYLRLEDKDGFMVRDQISCFYHGAVGCIELRVLLKKILDDIAEGDDSVSDEATTDQDPERHRKQEADQETFAYAGGADQIHKAGLREFLA
jgi:hypothetical protein